MPLGLLIKVTKLKGFTMLELLVVIAIIGILSSIALVVMSEAKDRAYYSRALADFKSIHEAYLLYQLNNNNAIPGDEDRSLPPNLVDYLGSGDWASASWPGSVFDWDNWDDPVSPEDIVQVSIRFCNKTPPYNCRFPNESWATNFNQYSSVYYCFQGDCIAHINHPTAEGLCVNCTN